MSRKIALVVEYRGTHYNGWQVQKTNVLTVQGHLEAALSKIANHEVKVICAGRTDSGVHACAQVVHFETTVERNERAWTLGVNSNLPSDIAVVAAKEVHASFHARFSALSRRYRYVILQSALRPALLNREITWTHKTLDVVRMQAAATVFLGKHDFTSFRAVGCQAHSPVRTILNFEVEQIGAYIVLDVRANAFLHHMIRNFAGLLISIGAGEKPVSWAEKVLAARDRTVAGVTAKPHGLYFVHAEYPAEFNIPNPALGPHFLPYREEPNYELSR